MSTITPTIPENNLNLRGIREFIDTLQIAKLTNRDYKSHINILFRLLPNNPVSSTEIVNVIKTQTLILQKLLVFL